MLYPNYAYIARMKTIILYLNFKTGEYIPYKTLKILCEKRPEFKYKTLQRQMAANGEYSTPWIVIKRSEIVKE